MTNLRRILILAAICSLPLSLPAAAPDAPPEADALKTANTHSFAYTRTRLTGPGGDLLDRYFRA